MPQNEAQTRALLIDPLLREAGWRLDDKTQVGIEIPVDGYDKEPWNGITDYCLFDPTGDHANPFTSPPLPSPPLPEDFFYHRPTFRTSTLTTTRSRASGRAPLPNTPAPSLHDRSMTFEQFKRLVSGGETACVDFKLVCSTFDGAKVEWRQ